MSAKYTLASDTTAGDRLLYVGQDSVQLSTGDVVFLDTDPAQANPTKIGLYVATGATRGTQTLIATLNASTAAGATFLLNHALPQCLALCRDASDNLYVIGGDGAATAKVLSFQAFIKQAGLNWIPGSAAYCTTPVSSNIPPVGYVALWCNTGGGTRYPAVTGSPVGHVIVAATTNDGSVTNACFILDAGQMLAGTPHAGSVTINPGFIGDSATLYGCNLDLSAQGFGATQGMAISAQGTTDAYVTTWGVSSTGILTTGGGAAPMLVPTGTLSAATKLRIAWDPLDGLWAIAYPSAANAGQVTVAPVSLSFGSLLTVDSGVASNFPAPSATLSWDISIDPSGEVWIYGWSSATATAMLRVPVTFPAGVPHLGSVVTDDTSIGATNTTIRCVKEPTDWFHADWQAYVDVSGTYSLAGDYSVLPVTPNVPTLVSPTNNAAAPFAGGGTFDWNFTSPDSTDAQVTYYLRFHTSAGYQWWNGSGLTTAQAGATGGNEAAVTSAVTDAPVASSILSTGPWSWSVQVTGSSGIVSGYSPSWIVNVAAQPATPTLTATYDATNNRVVLTVAGTGTDDAWFEYSDDGANWYDIRGATSVAQVSGAATVYDWEPPSATPSTRSYRVSQISPSGIAGNYSQWSSTATASWPVPAHFGLRDPLLMTVGISPHVLANTLSTSFGQQLTEHNPPGRQDTVIVADVVGLEDGGCTFFSTSVSDDAALMTLLLSNHTLRFQTTDGRAWFIALNAPRPIDSPYLVAPNAYRAYAVTWRGQQRPPA